MDYPCDEYDCPTHPVYLEEERIRIEEKRRLEREEADRKRVADLAKSGNVLISIANGQQMLTVENTNTVMRNNSMITGDTNSMKVKLPCMEQGVDLHCLLCHHFKRFDIKKKLIIDGAKKALQGK